MRDLEWIIPFGGATAALIASDDRTAPPFQRVMNRSTAARLSDATLAGYFGAAGGMYLWGRMAQRDGLRTSGELVAESLLHSFTVSELSKYVFLRDRPVGSLHPGRFWDGGDSFPSGHSMLAWSAASTIAHRYPGPMTKIVVYGAASSVSLSRVMAGKHYASDVFVGGVAGYLIGRKIYQRQEERELALAKLGTFTRELPAATQPSPYVQLDHWSYAAVVRLSALGLVDSAFLGHRPWTRQEFARIAREARLNLTDQPSATAGDPIVRALEEEFAKVEREDLADRFRLESVYTRFVGISGDVLTDGFHFQSTLSNDFGRPFARGFNAQTGISGWTRFGHLLVHVRGEYQHSPDDGGASLAERTLVGTLDGLPTPPAFPRVENRIRFLDAYGSYATGPLQISFGLMTNWWGQSESGSLNFSNNAEPVLMFKVDQTRLVVLPGIFSKLGPFRTQFFIGRLDGHHYTANFAGLFGPHLRKQPLIHGQKLTFKPTPDFEFSISVTTLFGGDGFPLNARAFVRSFGISNTFPGQPADPGDRRAGFDFRYRIPGLRRWLTLYNDSMTEDEFSPIAYPRRSAMAPGLFLAQFPGIPRLDLRVESAYTALPNLRASGSYYFNNRFKSGFTNQGMLLGHPVGRDGTYYYGQLRYWFAPRRTLDFSLRRTILDSKYLVGGGRTEALKVGALWYFGDQVEVAPSVQYERWAIPALGPKSSNVAATLQFRFWPARKQ